MRNKLSQNQKFLQKFSLTPQMRQSIALLAMSTSDIHDFVDEAIEANPFLKKEAMPDMPDRYRKPGGAESLALDFDPMAGIKHEENPRTGLLSQLKMLALEDDEGRIAEYLIYEMDDNGYINVDIDDAAEELSVPSDEVEAVLKKIQGLEPIGIGARDVGECLQIQLERSGKKDSTEYAVVTRCMQELATNDIDAICARLKIDAAAAKSAIAAIKRLNPRPASTLLSRHAKPIVPDVITHVSKHGVRLELNKGWLPHLELYNPYSKEKEIVTDGEAGKFIKKQQDAAIGLIEDLRRREETIYRVAEYVVKAQRQHIIAGKESVKPLSIKEVAQALEMHPSTISRSISNKFIALPDKVVPLSTLLSRRAASENGSVVSVAAIKDKIRRLTAFEDRKSPLRDDAIQRTLAAEGIKIERRTVAKYREALKILPSHLRRVRQ